MISALVAGLLAGYGIAVPVGAVALYVMTLGAAHGFPTAAAGGLGAASVDAVYAGAAVVFGALLAPIIVAGGAPLRWLSAVALVGVSVTLLLSGLRGQAADARSPAPPSPRRAFATVFAITLVNPATVIYFTALVAGSTVIFTDPMRTVAFVLAAGIASASWQLLVAGVGAGLGRALAGAGARRWTAVAGAAMVMVLAIRTLTGR